MKDFSNGQLDKIRDFAQRTNQEEQFNTVLNNLLRREKNENVGNGGKPSEIRLFPDSAPYSLYWEWVSLENQENPRLIMNGGLIYHGQHDRGDGNSPNFTVNITPTTGWKIHT